MQYTSYIWISIAGAAASAGMGFYAWRHRSKPGAKHFMVIMLLVVVWLLTNMLEITSVELQDKIFWENMQYLGFVAAPVAYLALALQYSGRSQWLTRRRLLLLAVIPFITLALVWTNDFHGLIRRNIDIESAGSITQVAKTYGPWLWVHAGYTSLMCLTAIFLVAEALLNARTYYRWQHVTLLIGFIALPVISALYIYIPGFLSRLIPTPVLFVPPIAAIAWGLFRYNLFNLAPIARDRIFENMSDGVIVLDSQNRIVDLNPAAQRILASPAYKAIGQAASSVLSDWPDLVRVCCGSENTQTELVIESGNTPQNYELQASALTHHHQDAVGRLIILHNITMRKQVEERLRCLSLTDPLTGLPNRRQLIGSLQNEVARARRYCIPLSMIMIDVDDLKHINDTYGHSTGDAALKMVARALRTISRKVDLAARYAGDEFILLMPHTLLDGAECAARRLLESMEPQIEDGIMPTISVGVAILEPGDDDQGKELLARADAALYMAKQSGRGQISTAIDDNN
jgi:diguanylate cyclase (GGDEF)-like protein/PAS domain S-box-containing protein